MKISSDFAASVIVAGLIVFAYALVTARHRAKRAAQQLAKRADERRHVRQMVADIEDECASQALERARSVRGATQ